MTHRYHCGNKRCRAKGRAQDRGMSPSEVRAATGSPVRCPYCGDTLIYEGRIVLLNEEEQQES